jgi:hypothetical protein
MAKAKLNFRRLSVPEKVAKAKQVVTSLTDNPNFPNPSPSLAAMTAGINELEAAYRTTQAAKQSLKSSVSDQSAKEDRLDQLMSQSASYVESVAGNDEKLIHEAGMDTKAAASAPSQVSIPTGLEVTTGDKDGELDPSWDKVAGARSYVIQISLDPPTATSWTHAGTSTKSSTTITGLNSGTRYWFRVAAVGASGQSGWSDPATRIAP